MIIGEFKDFNQFVKLSSKEVPCVIVSHRRCKYVDEKYVMDADYQR